MLAVEETCPVANRGETSCKYTASQEPLKCENWIVLPKGRTMSLGLDLWHISFLTNQCLCAGRLHSEPRPVPLRNRVWGPHRHPSCPALSEGLTPTCFKEAKAKHLWYLLYDAVKGVQPLQNVHQLSVLRLPACHSMWSLSVPVD